MPTHLNAHDERDKSAHGERAPLFALVIAMTKNAVSLITAQERCIVGCCITPVHDDREKRLETRSPVPFLLSATWADLQRQVNQRACLPLETIQSPYLPKTAH